MRVVGPIPQSRPEAVPASGADTPGVGAAEHPHGVGRTGRQPAPRRDPRTLTDAGDLLRALAAPIRIAIVLQLRDADRCVHELVEALDVAQPLISQHLRVLKSAGVVVGDRHGREVIYRLVDDHLAHIVVDAVEHVEEPPAATSARTGRMEDTEAE